MGSIPTTLPTNGAFYGVSILDMKTFLVLVFLCASIASACLQDNCYRNFANNCNAASAFCASLTTAATATLTATPTFIRPECTVSRLSSACSCVFPKTVGPTETGSPCVPCPPGRQYVKNGEFDDKHNTDPNPPPPQWEVFTSGSNIAIAQYCDGNGANCLCQFADNVEDPGYGYITQKLTGLCSGKSYNISGAIGTVTTNPIYPISSSISVFLDDVKIYGPELSCSTAKPCTISYPGNNAINFRRFSIIATAARPEPNVTIRVDYVDNGKIPWGTWLEHVTVVGV